MSSPQEPRGNSAERVACVGAVVHDLAGRVLLVLRGQDPGRLQWSVPGGRIEPGESAEAAVVREVREETGLVVSVGSAYERVVVGDFDITDFECTVVDGALQAGDDAIACRWATYDELPSLDLVDGLFRFLTDPPLHLA